MQETNSEVKRVKVQKFGIHNFITSNEVKKIHEDEEYGELYHTKKLLDVDGKPFAFLKVINQTPEITNDLSAELMQIEGKIKYFMYLEKVNKITQGEKEEWNNLILKKGEIEKEIRVENKIYTLRINPEIKTAKEAWQSTFRKVKDFKPFIET
jgi:hypothetical protein